MSHHKKSAELHMFFYQQKLLEIQVYLLKGSLACKLLDPLKEIKRNTLNVISIFRHFVFLEFYFQIQNNHHSVL